MRVALDHFVNGTLPSGEIEHRKCVELRALSGAVWANVALEDGAEIPIEALAILSKDAAPQAVELTATPSGMWPTVALVAGAQISARPGFPRLVIEEAP